MNETTTTPASVPFRSSSTEAAARPTNTAPSEVTSKASSTQHRASTPDGKFSDDASPSVYQALEGKPYAVKFLKLDPYYDDKLFKDVPELTQQLDDYVTKQAEARGLTDSADSYKEVIDAIYKQIGKSTNEDPVKSLQRLSTAASAISRLESAKLQPVLSAANLTPTEYEGIQD